MRVVTLLTSLLSFLVGSSCFRGSAVLAEARPEVTLALADFEELFSSAKVKDLERSLMQDRERHEQEHQEKLRDLEKCSEWQKKEIQSQTERIFPDNFQVLQHSASGIFNTSSIASGVERDVASFDLKLILRIVKEPKKWTLVPLINTTATVASNWQVYHQNPEEDIFYAIDPVSDPSVLILLQDGQQVLATNHSGLFKVQYNAYTRVGKTRNLNSIGLSHLLYPLSNLSFRIAKDSTAFSKDYSVHPPSSVLQVMPGENYTDLIATLPLTADNFQIRWVECQEQEEEISGGNNETTQSSKDNVAAKTAKTPQAKKGSSTPQVTATHEVMHTVGEGIIRSVHTLEFVSTSEVSPLNSVEFAVYDDEVRVTSVSGHALEGWSSKRLYQEENSTIPVGNLVKATFKTSQLSSNVILNVQTEKDRLNPNQIEVDIPRIECKNVLRQTGQIAVIKDANVEVHEQKISGLSRVEPADLSSKLRLNVDRPIVLSYKYLNPKNQVATLAVKEHMAMETLEATIDRLHYKVVVTETHAVHSMILVLQSTKLQYLDIYGLPPSASQFTVIVNSVPAKPVKGEQKGGTSILVPLLIGLNSETANQGASLLTSVEVTYFSTHAPLAANGTISFDPPKFSLPISVLSAHLNLPYSRGAYDVNRPGVYKFHGDFGTEPTPRESIYPIPEAFKYAKGKRVVRDDYEFTVLDDMFPEDREEQGKLGAVKIVTPKAGRNFYFQNFLVLDGGLSLNVDYEPYKEKGKKVTKKKGLWDSFRSSS
mmetsp:Transcript_10712/g.16416  ORF Transcript_10712/g.16416 Transcript_10712/m.16416 type:complete len:766 (-) Transcript_10712:887-3184(-)|eukprot:CAMPEP_0178926214 /NCGR_PEP_ID=MMETSP0786-20121207/18392_1 /TAXON_ID=186022 /ORGANISM="Thalassionema frauenfeldii, Strain CCMP 1798" /LENGTH=765 /DNA_ID=CAMNT_0020601279 /DNA_START=8 /DNA_END=2305 /DNA_ORIENTATION=-